MDRKWVSSTVCWWREKQCPAKMKASNISFANENECSASFPWFTGRTEDQSALASPQVGLYLFLLLGLGNKLKTRMCMCTAHLHRLRLQPGRRRQVTSTDCCAPSSLKMTAVFPLWALFLACRPFTSHFFTSIWTFWPVTDKRWADWPQHLTQGHFIMTAAVNWAAWLIMAVMGVVMSLDEAQYCRRMGPNKAKGTADILNGF